MEEKSYNHEISTETFLSIYEETPGNVYYFQIIKWMRHFYMCYYDEFRVFMLANYKYIYDQYIGPYIELNKKTLIDFQADICELENTLMLYSEAIKKRKQL